MKLSNCLLIALLIATGNVAARGEKPFPELGDSSGGDCAVNYLVYDRIFSSRPSLQALQNATPIVNDVCNIGDYLRIVADGEQQVLNFVWGKTKENLSGTRSLYANERFSALLEIGRPLYKFRDPETECIETGYFVRVTISYAGLRRTVKGTLTGGCP